MVRVPLGWNGADKMIQDANPLDDVDQKYSGSKQTVEMRSPDGSADLYHLFAGLIMAAQHGLEMKNGLEMAEKLYVDIDIFQDQNKEKLNSFQSLPESCVESAAILEKKRGYFEKDGVFPADTIDFFISTLKSYRDKGLSERLLGKTEEIRKLVYKYLHHM